MRIILALSILFLTLVLLSNCSSLIGEEVARLSINQVSTDDNLVIQETSLDLKKDEKVAIWSEMDIKYEGNVELRFRLEILKDGENFGGFEIDPTDKNITIGEMKTTVMGKTDWSFSGKNSHFIIEEDGNYTFKAILVASENKTLEVTKADIVLKK